MSRSQLHKTLLCAAASLGLAGSATNARADAYADGLAAYANGDYARAMELLAPLAAQGNLSAVGKIGWMYVGGFGVAKDCAKGEAMVAQVARSGDARAQYAMGRIYGVGACGIQNAEESFSWYRKAANQRDPDAAFALGLAYAESTAVPRNLGEAYCWFRASIKYFDEAYSAIPIDSASPIFANKRAAEKNVGILAQSLTNAQLQRGERLSCIAEVAR